MSLETQIPKHMKKSDAKKHNQLYWNMSSKMKFIFWTNLARTWK